MAPGDGPDRGRRLAGPVGGRVSPATSENGLHIRAGQELTHFKLLPGEEVRTPLMVLQFWKGATGFARRTSGGAGCSRTTCPGPAAKLPPPQLAACSSHQFGEMINANEPNPDACSSTATARRGSSSTTGGWTPAGIVQSRSAGRTTGTWEVDTQPFPARAEGDVSDHAHAKGVKIIVWFEPERVTAGTWLADKHPEWVLGGKSGGLLNLGNARPGNWLTDHVDKLIDRAGHRSLPPGLQHGPAGASGGRNDAAGPAGHHRDSGTSPATSPTGTNCAGGIPNMLIDSCASGGRRNDLETLRRAVPLLRSDYILEPVGNQCHTYGISFWVPFYGTGTTGRSLHVPQRDVPGSPPASTCGARISITT